MYLVKTPLILRKITGKNLIWKMPVGEKRIFLTFDDGPIPELTPQILEILNQTKIKATFFCVGENITKHPVLYNQIINQGHSTGSHTFNHLNGWKTSKKDYIDNIKKCETIFQTSLFRPPYGKITISQIKQIKKKYRIILWTVLSGDFDIKTTKEQCLDNVLKNTKDGDIVVFHDNIKAKEKVLFALPKFIQHFKEKGFNFETIN